MLLPFLFLGMEATAQPPANDLCANAQPITVQPAGGCPAGSTSGTNVGADLDGGIYACYAGGFPTESDVWYSFNSGANTSVNISIPVFTIATLILELKETCGGASTYCQIGGAALNQTVTVTPGTNYLVRIASDNSGQGTFDLCIQAASGGGGSGPCCTAHAGQGCENAACQAAICAADPFCCDTQWDGLCAGDAIANANGGGACAGISDCPGGGGGAGPCCTPHASTGCENAACQAAICAADPFCCDTQWDGLCSGAAVTNANGGGACANVSDCPGGGGGGLANDDCGDAIVIGDGVTPFTTVGSTGTDITSCTFNDTNDVWFEYVATCTGFATATTCGGASYDTALAAFSACGGAELACNDDACGLQSTISFPVTAGTSYWVRVSGYNGATGTGDLTLSCLDEADLPPNNDCADVIPVVIPVPGGQSFSGDATGATDNSIGGSYGAPQVWEAFTITECSDVTIDLCGSPSVFDPMFIGISSGCPAGFPDNYVFSTTWAFSCGDGNIELFFLNLQPGTYYVPIYASPGGPYVLNVTTAVCAGAPENDECADAVVIGDGVTPFTTLGSTGMDITSCTFEDVNDVWFEYVATCTGVATATTCNDANYDSALAAFSDCGGAELACNDDAAGCGLTSTITFPVVAGTSYWIRVSGFSGASGTGNLTMSCNDGPPPPGGPCCTAHPGTGCEDAACQAAICAADPFCCDTSWDGLCAGAAVDNANAGGVCDGVSDCDGEPPPPGDGPCCTANATPGCEDAACQAAICAADPFCCNNSWDGFCAGAAVNNAIAGGVCTEVSDCPGSVDPPDNNDCDDVTPVLIPVPGGETFTGNSLGGTDSSVGGSYGAPQVWEAFIIEDCADVTIDLCGSPMVFDPMFIGISSGCPAEFPGNFVFSTSWSFSCGDGNIVLLYLNLQPGTYWVPVISQPGGPYVLNISTVPCGSTPTGPCCTANGTPGCDDAACEAAICAADPFCCNTSWDGICAGAALANAQDGGVCSGVSDCPSSTGACCTANGTPGCANLACETAICASDPFCCDTAWDADCAGAAIANANAGGACAGVSDCPSGPSGPCCSANGTPGCEDAACEALICAADPFCCNTSWDGICAASALANAEEGGPCAGVSDCPTGSGLCCTANGTPGCSNAACESAICADDPFCCDTEWDATCAGAAIANADAGGACAGVSDCPDGPPPPPGPCCTPNAGIGCEDAGCSAVVCAADPFCCETMWDGLCSGAAIANAQAGGACQGVSDCPSDPPPPGDGPCCTANPTPGCEDGPCQAVICAADPFCCNTEWDGLCAGAAIANAQSGGVCLGVSDCTGEPPTAACCTAHPGTGCEDAACTAVICAADPFCCETEWDGLCAGAAIDNANNDGACAGVSDCPGDPDPPCEPVGAIVEAFEKISNVTFADIDNSSTSNAGYENFTFIQANVLLNGTYPISVTIDGGFAEDQVYVWIDFDQSGTLDPTELVYVSELGPGPHTGNINIPLDALLGVTLMRVRLVDMHDGSEYPNIANNTPCGLSTYGQVEDYAVKIEQNVGVDAFSGPAGWTVFPNPSNGDITLLYGGESGKVGLEIYDMTGRLVYTGQEVIGLGAPAQLQLAGKLAPGTYVIRMAGEFGTHEKRIVIQR